MKFHNAYISNHRSMHLPDFPQNMHVVVEYTIGDLLIKYCKVSPDYDSSWLLLDDAIAFATFLEYWSAM